MPLLIQPAESVSRPPAAIELRDILPEKLAGLSSGAIARLPISIDGRPATLGDAFTLSGDCADGMIECRGDFSHVHQLGAGMTHGLITVDGDVGRHAAAEMTGGRFTTTGRAGDWLAAGMRGGDVIVGGSVGDNAAGALPGRRHGMEGGRVLVGGDAGALAGSRMRRGLLLVGRACGEGVALEMRAGTVVTMTAGRHRAVGMGRGSLVLLEPIPADESPAAGFSRGGRWMPGFLPLLARSLPSVPPWDGIATRLASGPWQQWHGDPLGDSRGEILCPADGA
jgi:formylmethanofuran dehydrogenase subunit C